LENLEMKKTLVAIAALAAFGAQAQSSVTMTGYFDRGYLATDNSNNASDFKGLGSNAGTTGLVIRGTEDLGNGLSAGFSIGTDFADLAGASQDGAATTASSIQTGGFNNAQSFLEVASKTIGTLRLGTVNNEILTAATGVAAPALSTAVGSAYSSAFSTHDGYNTGRGGNGGIVNVAALGATNGGARGIRQANTIKYISPKFMDVTVAYGFVPKNENGTVDTVGVTDMSIRYAKGPLDIMYASLKFEVGATAPANGGLTANSDNTQTLLAASYAVMPTLKLHAGFGESKASATTIANSKSTQYGVTYTMGNIDLMAQMASVDNKNGLTSPATGVAYTGDRKMTGLGLNYNLSKTTRAYVRYDNMKFNDGALASNGDTIKRTAFGVSRSF
jgi:predicted porin